MAFKNALGHLQRLFDLYKNLIERKPLVVTGEIGQTLLGDPRKRQALCLQLNCNVCSYKATKINFEPHRHDSWMENSF